MTEVSCAIIVNDLKILAVQRGPESSHPWQWEFPGGKIHHDETAARCIIREIEEELTIRIENLIQLQPIDFDYGIKQIRLIPFLCRIVSGAITLTEHLSMRWLKLEELNTVEWLGADRELIIRNKEVLKLILSGDEN